MSAAALVHAPGFLGAQAGDRPAAISDRQRKDATTGRGGDGLPGPVADMREAILEAVRSGSIDDLRHAVELNEVRPIIGDGSEADAVAALLAASTDGKGRDVLEAIGRVLEAPWVAVPLGADIENNRIYVWPRFAETGVTDLAPADAADLAKLLPAEARAAMIAKGAYDRWRVGIAADGTWHFLRR